MSVVKDTKTYLFNSDLGNIVIQVNEVEKYDIEDVIRDRAKSQARRIQFINLGKNIDINQTTTQRSKSSVYLKNTQEFEE